MDAFGNPLSIMQTNITIFDGLTDAFLDNGFVACRNVALNITTGRWSRPELTGTFVPGSSILFATVIPASAWVLSFLNMGFRE